MPTPPAIVELRQYTLFGGRRDALIALFEREFIAPQAELGAPVLGTFRDLEDPDRFVWWRGFSDMDARKTALETFYGGPVWAAHRSAANATMVDSDNVLLLRPVGPTAAADMPVGVLRVAIHGLRGVDGEAFARVFDQALAPVIAAAGGGVRQRYLTEASPNTFPRLPVREDEAVFVWTAAFADAAGERAFSAKLTEASGWRDAVPAELLPALMRKPEVLRLAPTEHSPMR